MHWTLAIGIALAMPLFIACQDGEPVTTDDAMDAAENAAEDTGRVLEEAAEKVEDAAEDAAHDMGDLVEDTADEVEDAADSLNN
jgi:hypothetical protein